MPKRPYSGISASHTAVVKRRKYMGGPAAQIGRVPRSKFSIKSTNNPSIFPPKLRQTLVYSETFQVTTGALIGIPTYNQWRLNGLNDPRVAVGGHQPTGFDQLMAMYVKYTVLGAKITCTFTAADAVYYSGDCGINITDPTATVGPNTYDLIENQYSTYGCWSQSANPPKLTIGLDCAKYFGIKDMTDEADCQGTQGTDPSRQVYATVWTSTHKGVAQVVNFTIKIEYDTMFVEPRNVTSS